MASDLVNNYVTMLQSEERLFTFGESSLFLLISRKQFNNSPVERNRLTQWVFISNSELYKIMANPD
jgi:hypothetical protein